MISAKASVDTAVGWDSGSVGWETASVGSGLEDIGVGMILGWEATGVGSGLEDIGVGMILGTILTGGLTVCPPQPVTMKIIHSRLTRIDEAER
jgi:hypothetical protein